ncbi:FAD/NAD(P)-binding protein [Ancylobacter sp. A5.8]|uniref:FAD/NAD(P)-binding protein n=1 Tax=Ancylobacter gelatini TaxID=2919920 RepID=UPI001F4E5C2A|nr:FAD/NAD(P)-binding protein [Ancylobacter gelatini]MCJ8142619.1 FAD/NAD(P)-binding protein [Ancylobacter gelatini]
MRRAVIVGGGANGTWMSVQLAQLPSIGEIIVIDRDGRFGRGVAYCSTADHHRINVPAERMGGSSPDDSLGFAQWLRRAGHAEPADFAESFVPRRLYGDYLCAQLDAVIAQGNVRLRQAMVQAIECRATGHAVLLDTGEEIEADVVVLCLGNPPPGQMASMVPGPRLVPDIWRPAALEAILPEDDVLVIGTGATAVDAVLELADRGTNRPIRMVSRHGRLPLIDEPSAKCEAVTGVPVDTALGMMRGLRAAVAAHTARGIGWQAVVDEFRLNAVEIWLGLPDAERRRFLRHLRSIWMVHRHRLAPDVAARLRRLQETGRLEIVAARVLGGEPTPEGYAVRLHRSGAPSGTAEMLEVDWALNCTGPDENYARSRDPLVASLLKNGMARPGPFGLGLDCDLQHRLLNQDGKAQSGLYLVGPPSRGRFWEVTSAPSGRDQCIAVRHNLDDLLKALAAPPR